MNQPRIGIVIPVVQKKYIINLIRYIKETVNRKDITICIVNDGNHKINQYLYNHLSEDIKLLILEKNKCFAGANNAGWKYLLEKYPSLDYLVTLNDDTIPKDNWLDNLVESIEVDKNIALCGPVMISLTKKLFKNEINYSSTWKLGDEKQPMVIKEERIENDAYVSVIGGFCFLARVEALKQVDYFDERYKNSCEDIDLCLKLTKNNWDLKISHKSFVIHKCGKSRFKKNTNTNIILSRKLLFSKWGNKLYKYNLQ